LSIWIASLANDGVDDSTARRVIGGPGSQWAGAFSPDGRWLAYTSTEGGRSEVYLRPYPDLASRRFVVSNEGGAIPTGRRTAASSSTAAATPCTRWRSRAGRKLPIGAPKELFRGQFHFQRNGDQSFDVFPDNQRFLMIQPSPESRRELRVLTDALAALDGR